MRFVALFGWFVLTMVRLCGQGRTGAQELILDAWPKPGHAEVLLSAGQAGLGQVFWVTRDPDQRLRVGCDWVGPEPAWASSEPFDAPPLPASVVVVTALLGDEPDSFHDVALQVAGQLRLRAQRGPEGFPATVQLGRNHVGGSTALSASALPSRWGREASLADIFSDYSPEAKGGTVGLRALKAKDCLALQVTPSPTDLGAQVLFDFSAAGVSQTLTIERAPQAQVAFQWQQAGAVVAQKNPVAWPAEKEAELWINFPHRAGPSVNREDELAKRFLDRYLIVLGEEELLLFAPADVRMPMPELLVVGRSIARTGQRPFTGQWRNLRAVRHTEFLARLQQHWRRSGPRSSREGEWPVGYRILAEVREDLTGRGSPLLVSGVTGRADFIHLVWTGPGRAKIGVDHWGVAAVYGDEFALAPGRCEIEILAEGWRPQAENRPHRVEVNVDGKTVFSRDVVVYPFDPPTLRLGVNFPGGSTTTDIFEGVFLDVTTVGDRPARP